jgi:V8-like Glu-specific endopeptidase
MRPGRFLCALAAACAWLAGTSLAGAQTAPIKHTVLPYTLKSGLIANHENAERQVYSEVVNGGDVPWMRLGFGHVQLAPGSRLQLTSLLDGATQDLTAVTLAQWQHTSAYFNGSLVRVTLIAAPGSRTNAVEIDRVIVGEWVAGGIESQCGPTDDRVPSEEPARARLMNIGCTTSIYNEQSCLITAGHCVSGGSINVVEFNVPPSLSNGTPVHPGPEDQYAWSGQRQFQDSGPGNDWGLIKVFPNTQTGLMPFEAQGAMVTLGTSLPPVNTTLRIVGYGVDSGTRNQTQQVHTGPLVQISGTTMRYQVDTEGGNSGSAVTIAADDVAVAVHTHAGCNVGGGGSNQGTAITQANLQAALASFCPVDDGITCGEVFRMQATCNANRRLTVQVRMTDTSNQGQTVVAAIDGSPINVALTLQDGAVGRAVRRVSSGAHTVSLIDPAGCANIPDVQVTCP